LNGFTSVSHAVGLIATAAATAALVPLARSRRGSPTVALVSIALAAVLAGNLLGLQAMRVRAGEWSVSSSLPLYLCDVAAAVAALALLWPKAVLVELTWFWAMAGALIGVIVPDHTIAFPSYDWLEYYVGHGGVVVAAALLVIGCRLHPQPGALWRVIGITFASIAVVGAIDAVTGGNYDYLRPIHVTSGSLLNLLGPWPWYIVVAACGEVVLLSVLDIPFWRERRRAPRT
jgi:hypothetical integral membrane protein (TIGR02206 family)